MRYCKYCDKGKDDSEFYETSPSKRCKECSNEVSKQRYHRLREKILEFKRQKKLKWKEREFQIIYVPLDTKAIQVNEKTLEIEDEYCREFTCGRKLSLQEKLFGKRCIKHPITADAEVL